MDPAICNVFRDVQKSEERLLLIPLSKALQSQIRGTTPTVQVSVVPGPLIGFDINNLNGWERLFEKQNLLQGTETSQHEPVTEAISI
jgi:hypothetical protein